MKKECCSKCGFPLDMTREPVFLTNSILGYMKYDDNKCKECGHQTNGSTITCVHKHWTNMCHKFHTERKELIKFLKEYDKRDAEERKEVCVMLPRFMRPSYRALENKEKALLYMDIEEPYSWNVVMIEVLGNTSLSKVMVRDINYEQVGK